MGVTNASSVDPWLGSGLEFEFERNFKWSDVGPYFRDNVPLVIAISLAYVVAVFAGQRYMKDRPAFDLQTPLICWNGLLTVLSWIMAIRTVPALLMRLAKYSLDDTTCDSSFSDGTVGFWVFVFTASKLPELVDTAFLILRKKPVILLHWYHHFTVLLYTWYAFSVVRPTPEAPHNHASPGLWFVSMNSFVHAFMYLYYFETSRGKSPSWNKYITVIQITQMFIGSAITINDALRTTPCAGPIPLYAGGIMYFSYFMLFVHLFYDMYCGAGARKRAARAAAKRQTAKPVNMSSSDATTTSTSTDASTGEAANLCGNLSGGSIGSIGSSGKSEKSEGVAKSRDDNAAEVLKPALPIGDSKKHL